MLEGNPAPGGAGDAPIVARVAVKPPPFWRSDPALWFAQLEAQFAVAGVTLELTKYYHIVGSIDTAVLAQVADIVRDTPAENPYTTLKNRLISCFAESQEKRLERLLQGIPLGDKRPTQLLRELRNIARSTISDEVLKSIFLRSLPLRMQAILAVSQGDLDQIALTADKLHDVPDQNVLTVQESSKPTLQSQLHDLSESVARLEARLSRPRSPTPQRSSTGLCAQYCWYHMKFGKRARRCTPPCEFPIQGNDRRGRI